MGSAFAWFREATLQQRRSLLAASLGWMLDSMDTMLYAMVLSHLLADLGMSLGQGGLLASLTLISSAVGGVLFGVIADRVGRTRALMGSVLVYSVFTFACGLASNVIELAVFRIFLGIGMGGEWATGAALVSETWPAKHRGKALGLVQSSWAVGYAVAALVTLIIQPLFGWRAVFFVGIVPALLTLWIRRAVPEPEVWKRSKSTRSGGSELVALAAPGIRRHVVVATAMNAATMFAWWGLFTWIPTYLGRPIDQGGAGLGLVKTPLWIVLMQVGMWFGYVTFGYVSDTFGRRKTYIVYLLAAALVVPIYGSVRDPTLLLVLGPIVAFFGTGYFSGFGVITAELFPTSIRATAQGLTYNLGRALSAAAPYTIGALAVSQGLGLAFNLVSAAFLVAALFALALPETRGREIT